MIIHDLEFFHGVALVKVVRSGLFKTIEKFEKNNSAYLIDREVGLYIKYSKKRMPPWVFTFSKEHIKEVKNMHSIPKKVFIALICNNDGICCLNWEEFCTVISIYGNKYPKWIKASRKKSEKYFVYGSDGRLKYKIGNSDFPPKLKNLVNH